MSECMEGENALRDAFEVLLRRLREPNHQMSDEQRHSRRQVETRAAHKTHGER